MGVTTNPIYASEAFLPISFRAADFLQIYVPFLFTTDAAKRLRRARSGDCHGDFKSVGELSFKTYVDWSTAEVVFLRFV